MREWALMTAVAAGLLATSADATGQSGFVEEFEALDRQRWFVSDGWKNGSYQNCQYSARAVEVRSGVLRLTLDQATDGPEAYVCAEIQSEQRFGHGTFEARVRVPFASGTNSNFFTFIGPPQGVPHHEIDFEFIARTGPALQTNTYVDGLGGNEVLIPVKETEDWHDIAFVWEPGRLRWYMDGALIREVEGETVPDLPQKMFLSVWPTGILTEWLGEFHWNAPLVLEVDRVAHSPLGSGCLFVGSILCRADFYVNSPYTQD
ncbi:family 16 glycosylhydrolase [Cereibacter sphaeroides]|uniref:family 16 glycosylhydrolase n=1 Tax=Cereibacter sphaeroides TaxID=1063 RepID=UPI001F403CD6|nr:family 16 glycosylhydrolase [Cereibacter sphaeroides]MCE6949655.1 family 16 glycosylhydrolase [Cereibacter sphaeroides]